MAKKDFSGVNTGRVYNTIEQATTRKGQQGKASPQEQAERAEQLRTQGRKGCKSVRINMAFTLSNYDYIRVMARVTGTSMTQFTNLILSQYREEHPEIYQQAKSILEQVKGESMDE